MIPFIKQLTRITLTLLVLNLAGMKKDTVTITNQISNPPHIVQSSHSLNNAEAANLFDHQRTTNNVQTQNTPQHSQNESSTSPTFSPPHAELIDEQSIFIPLLPISFIHPAFFSIVLLPLWICECWRKKSHPTKVKIDKQEYDTFVAKCKNDSETALAKDEALQARESELQKLFTTHHKLLKDYDQQGENLKSKENEFSKKKQAYQKIVTRYQEVCVELTLHETSSKQTIKAVSEHNKLYATHLMNTINRYSELEKKKKDLEQQLLHEKIEFAQYCLLD